LEKKGMKRNELLEAKETKRGQLQDLPSIGFSDEKSDGCREALHKDSHGRWLYDEGYKMPSI
jgi:hypothetical protein